MGMGRPMNNKKTIYRVAQGSFYGVGPYKYLNDKYYENDGFSYTDVSRLIERLYSKERWSNDVTILDKINKCSVYTKHGIFSTFNTNRPGAFDDPMLKDSINKRYGSREQLSQVHMSWHGFGFDSKEQLEHWFNDPIELLYLKKFGFSVFRERIKTSNILFGWKQVWVLIP